jgi:hypothetical protein
MAFLHVLKRHQKRATGGALLFVSILALAVAPKQRYFLLKKSYSFCICKVELQGYF